MAAVLLVDDDVDSREAVARFLGKAGHRVSCVPNGREALAALSAEMPDVVILDQRMPEMDGVTFLEVIRCYLRWQHLPVILLTAYADANQMRRAKELGAVQTLTKADYGLSELLSYIERCTRITPDVPAPGSSRPDISTLNPS